MRIVLDTNVLVSGLLSAHGPPAWILDATLAGEFEPVFNMAIRAEYVEVLSRPEFKFPGEQIDGVLLALDQFGTHVAAVAPWPNALPDPDDEIFLAVAAASGSTLITGNTRHYPAKSRLGVLVMTPREFVDHYRNM